MSSIEVIELKEVGPQTESHARVSAFIADQLHIGRQFLDEQAGQQQAIVEFESRPYQLDAWASVWQAREEGADRGLIRLATGLGKTSVAAFDYAKFRSEQSQLGNATRALFVVHQNNILSQASKRFSEIIPAASSSHYANTQGDLPKSELTFATFQTLRAGSDRFPPNFFDYIIYDEAHHIEAETYKKVVDYFQPRFQLGLTATPNRMDRRDITRHFGEPLFAKTLPEAISEGYLADVDYNIVFDDAVKRALQEGFSAENTAEIKSLFEVQTRNEVIVENIRTAQERIRAEEGTDSVKTIVFCEDVQTTREFARLLQGESYNSSMRERDQQKVFQDFMDGNFEDITVRDMFNEGVDVPDARLLVFLRTTQSKTVFEQQLGRGLRRTKNKNKVTVLDFVANIDRLIMLQELAETIFNERPGTRVEEIQNEKGLSIFFDEHNRFVFDKSIIDLLEAYQQLLDKEEFSVWKKRTNNEIIQIALSISPNAPLGSAAINSMNRTNFPHLATISNRFGSLRNFQRACGFDVKDWDAVSSSDLVQLALSLSPENALRMKDVQALEVNMFPSVDFIKQRFGSWANFQRACGFDVVIWEDFSNQELVDLAKQLSPDAPLRGSTMDNLNKNEFPHSTTIASRFGSLTAFHIACGFEPAMRWREYSDQDIIDLALSISRTAPLTSDDLEVLSRTEFPSLDVILKRFGTLANFQRACGFAIRPEWRKYSNDDIIDLARRLSPDQVMSQTVIISYGNMEFPSKTFIRERFGSIKNFQDACELPLGFKWTSLSNDEIVQLALSLSPTQPLSIRQVVATDRASFPSHTLIKKRFGNWSKFLKECGFEEVDWSVYSNDSLVALAKELNPNGPMIQKVISSLDRSKFPSVRIIKERFGTISNFHEACGYDVTNKSRPKRITS